jgi:hypothetical protein
MMSTVQALAIWDTLDFGNSANMATKTTWTCPAAGLWYIAAMFGFNMNTNDKPCSFQLYHNGAEVWYFTTWYIWDTLDFGNSANMATKTTWTCPAAGLRYIAAMFGFNMNTNDKPCSFQLYHNGAEVWYFTAWYNIAAVGEGITTQCKSIFLNLAAGNTLEW